MKTFHNILILLAVGLTWLPNSSAARQAEKEIERSKSFTVQQGGRLEVDVDPGNVRLEPWDKNEVHIEAENIDEDHPERLKMSQSGNDVTLKYRERGGWGRRSGPRFYINVPVRFNVEIKTTGGNVEQSEVLKGSFSVDTRGGNVTMDEIDGNVVVESGGGHVTGSKIDGDIRVKTGGGNVTIKLTTGVFDVTSGGGTIRSDHVGKYLKVHTGGGNVTVGDVGGDAWVETGGGNLRVGKVLGKLDLGSGGGNISVEGASGTIKLHTGGGNVSMNAITGTVEVKTGGGSVKLELIPGGKGDSRVLSGGGDIRLFIPENAKCLVDAQIKLRSGWGGRHRRYDIRSDFKADKYEKNEDEDLITGTYTLNGGGNSIVLETTNGDIEIRKIK